MFVHNTCVVTCQLIILVPIHGTTKAKINTTNWDRNMLRLKLVLVIYVIWENKGELLFDFRYSVHHWQWNTDFIQFCVQILEMSQIIFSNYDIGTTNDVNIVVLWRKVSELRFIHTKRKQMRMRIFLWSLMSLSVNSYIENNATHLFVMSLLHSFSLGENGPLGFTWSLLLHLN